MEFRCRLGTAGGEIIEAVYVADSEARLRRELEEKGLFVLSLQRRGMLPAFGVGVPAGGHGRREFLVFNQELALSSKRGFRRAVLDILRQRVLNATFNSFRRVSKFKPHRASDAFGEPPGLFPAVYPPCAGGGNRLAISTKSSSIRCV